MPKVLTQDQIDSQVAICQEPNEYMTNDPTLLLNITIGDESIVYAYDPDKKTAIFATEESWVPKTQKSTYVKK
jgi:hypothetical protein